MEKIALNKNCKRILTDLQNNKYDNNNLKADKEDINLLVQENLINTNRITKDNNNNIRLNDFGKAYIHSNPKLKNPSIWDDKKYWITTFISLVAIVISIIALCK